MEIQRDFGNSNSFACYLRMLDAMGLIFYDLRVLTCATVSQSMSPIAPLFCIVPTEEVVSPRFTRCSLNFNVF